MGRVTSQEATAITQVKNGEGQKELVAMQMDKRVRYEGNLEERLQRTLTEPMWKGNAGEESRWILGFWLWGTTGCPVHFPEIKDSEGTY